MKRTALRTAALGALILAQPTAAAPVEQRPNIVIILTDDQGYGDIKALNPGCAVATPNMDRLCNEGAVLTESYSASAFCTPSRYSLLTGRYTWRTYAKVGFPQDPANFAPDPVPSQLPPYPTTDRMTIPKMLSKLGYRNGVVGKWHLVTEPEQLDFDYSFLHDGYFVKTNRFTENGNHVDYTQQLHYPPSLAPGTTWQQMIDAGGTLTNEDIGLVVPETTDRAVAFMQDHVANHAGQPFFLYFTPHAMHTPYNVPANFDGIDFTTFSQPVPNFGSTPHNYWNFLRLLDHSIGKILNTIDSLGIANDTIVIFSSDNGSLGYAWSIQASPDAGPPYNAPRGSVNNATYVVAPANRWSTNDDRYGFKTMSHDGGVHVPLMVRWPGKISPGITDATPRCLTDVFLTLADILHVPLGPEVAEDSFSFADVLLGTGASSRGPVVHHSVDGHLSLRDGGWKMIHANGHGGGGTYNGVATGVAAPRWTTDPAALQLYDFTGISRNETTNNASTQPALVASMVSTLQEFWGTDGIGRSRPNTPLDTAQDYDGDNIPDYIEFDDPMLDFLDPTDGVNHDNDGDGLLLSQEIALGTNPNLADSDGDGLWDGAEEANRNGILDPLAETDPLDSDSDDDGFSDYAERLGGSDPLDPASTPVISKHAVPISVQTVVGPEGNLTDPDTDSWQDPSGNPVSSRAFIRENKTQDTVGGRWFMKFDLSSAQSLPAVFGGSIRLHQYCRLNELNNQNSQSDVAIAPVTAAWSNQSGSLPLYEITTVGDPLVIGNVNDFGTALTSSGFFGGTGGRDISASALGWLDGSLANHGLRVSLTNEIAIMGLGFSTADDPATPGEDESPALLLDYVSHFGESGDPNPPVIIADQDGDGIRDIWELARYGVRGRIGGGDQDSDGVPDLIEYLLGLDPLSRDPIPTGSFQDVGGVQRWVVGFNYYASRSESDLVLEWNTSLGPATWMPVARVVAGGPVEILNGATLIDESGSEPATVQIALPAGHPTGFVRWAGTPSP